MGFWIEIHCDNQDKKESNWDGHKVQRCFSDVNEGPMGMARSSQSSAIKLIRGLEHEAKAKGWKKTKSGWICPFCAKQQ